MERKCPHCNGSMSHRRKDAQDCGSKLCAAETKRLYYLNHTRQIICKYCQNTFEGRGKRVCCDLCQSLVDNRPKQKRVRQLVCPRCEKPTACEEVYLTARTKTKNKGLVCEECKIIQQKEQSVRMKLDNPAYDCPLSEEEYQNKQNQRLQIKIERKENMRLRMKTNNPMHDPQTRLKVSQTLKDGLRSGRIKYRYGDQHHLYQGNRNINRHIRIYLKDWFAHIKQRDNFTCICGQHGGILHTHHLEALRDIIQKFNIKNLKGCVKNLNIQDLNELTQAVLRYHWENDIIGITLCHKCHGEKDEHYKRKNQKNHPKAV